MRMVNFVGSDNWFNSDLINEVRSDPESGYTIVSVQLSVAGSTERDTNQHDILVEEDVNDVMAYLSKTYTISFDDFMASDTGECFDLPEEVAGYCYIWSEN